MKRLEKIARTAPSGTSVQFRKSSYGSSGMRSFLRDVIALANASVFGPRYIVVGTDVDADGGRKIREISSDDFNAKPSYQSVVADFIEPQIRLNYHPVTIDGTRIGVFEIGDSQDRPYMMRADHSETLRRGDAYVRIQQKPVKMGRRQLQGLFEKKFRESMASERIEIGFPGETIHKELEIDTVDMQDLPSAVAAAKIKQLLDVKAASRDSGSTTVMSRLMHARLFGSDTPYEDRSADDLMREMAEIKKKYELEDQRFLFEQGAKQIQLVVHNHGDESILEPSLSLALPRHESLHIASRLPGPPSDDKSVNGSPQDQSGYPSISMKDDLVQVSHKLAEIPADTLLQVFESPLRICVGSDLKGRRLGIHYALSGKNLRNPVKGKLRLLF